MEKNTYLNNSLNASEWNKYADERDLNAALTAGNYSDLTYLAERGSKEAKSQLARLLCSVDEADLSDEAIYWIGQAAYAGDTWAMKRMGLAYLRGEGVGRNKPEALKWFERAANAGDAEAKQLLRYYDDEAYTVVKWHCCAHRAKRPSERHLAA